MSENINIEKNCFNLLKMMAAVSVAFGHYAIYAIKYSDVTVIHYLNNLWKVTAYFSGVVIFFAISGFLTSVSIERHNSAKNYFMKRFMRIYPPLWVSMIVNLLVFALISTKFNAKDILKWIILQGVGIAYTPVGLKDFATGSLNGALWTIFVQIQCYVVLWLYYSFVKNRSDLLWILMLIISIYGNLIYYYWGMMESTSLLYDIFGRTFIPFFIWFYMGAFVYHFKEQILIKLQKISPMLIVIYSVFRLSNIRVPGYYANIVTGILLPFAIIGIAYKIGDRFRVPDLSYSIFLYHWIILNIFVKYDIYSRIDWIFCLTIYLLITTGCAYCSWSLVEQNKGYDLIQKTISEMK